MDSLDLRTGLSPDLSVERLDLAASTPALQGHGSGGEVLRKARRRGRAESESEGDAGLEGAPDPGDEPEHQVDSLA